MIAWLSGRLRRKIADSLVIEVSGVGYQVTVPLSTYRRIPGDGEDVCLHIHTHVREDSLSLFGFLTEAEKEVFLFLIGVSGIGPKLALTVLSSLSVDEVTAAIQFSDEQKLSSVPGIGRKTAARMVLELKDKVKHFSSTTAKAGPPVAVDAVVDDVLSALMNLGYKKPHAEEALAKVRRSGLTVAELIREALNVLMKR